MAHLLWHQMAQITLRKQFHQIIFITVFTANASRSKLKGRISASSMHRHVRLVRLCNFERICHRLNRPHTYVFAISPMCHNSCVILTKHCGNVRLRGAVKSYHCKLKVWLVEAQGFTLGLSGASTHQHLLSHTRRFLWSVINCWAHFQYRCGSPQSPKGRLLYQTQKQCCLSLSLSLKSIYVALCFLISDIFSYLSWAQDHNPLPSPLKRRLLGNVVLSC